MRLEAKYLLANQAWVVTFGDALVPIGNPLQTIFPNRTMLERRLVNLGLELKMTGSTSGLIVTKEEYTDNYLAKQAAADRALLHPAPDPDGAVTEETP